VPESDLPNVEPWLERVRLHVVGRIWKLAVQEKPIALFCAVTIPDWGADADVETERFTNGVLGREITGVLETFSDAPEADCDQLNAGQGMRTPAW